MQNLIKTLLIIPILTTLFFSITVCTNNSFTVTPIKVIDLQNPIYNSLLESNNNQIYFADFSDIEIINKDEKTNILEDIFLYDFDSYRSDQIFEQYAIVETQKYTNETNNTIEDVKTTIYNTTAKYGYIDGRPLNENHHMSKAFIEEINTTYEYDFEPTLEKTWVSSTNTGVLLTLPPKEDVYLTTLAVGITSNGHWKYKKYSKGGSWLGYHYEPATGTVINSLNSYFVIH